VNSRDMIIDRNLTLEEICIGISQASETPLSDVLAVTEIYGSQVIESAHVLCHVQAVGGDFSQIISVYVRDDSVMDLSNERAGAFCEVCGCTCLVDSSDENPLAMLLVEGIKKIEMVYLSPDVIDEDKYVIENFHSEHLNDPNCC
jgi:hypothetical protein